MDVGDEPVPEGKLLTRPRLTRPEPVRCNCNDTIAITIDAAGHVATLHLCQWCGDSWDIDGSPASRDAVHALLPKSEALTAIWRRSAVKCPAEEYRPPRADRHTGGGARGPSCAASAAYARLGGVAPR
jgi:hypothetical protein